MMLISQKYADYFHKMMKPYLDFGYRSPRVNYLYLMFCWLGAIYFTDKISKRNKVIYAILSITTFSAYSVHLYMYYAYHKEYNKDMIVYAVAGTATMLYSHLFLPLSTYFYREEMNRIFPLLDEMSVPHFDSYFQKEESYSKALVVMIFVEFIGNTCFSLYCVVYLLLNYNEPDIFHEPYLYPLQTYYEMVETLNQYMIMLGSQAYGCTVLFFVGSIIPIFTMMVTAEFYNRFEYIISTLNEESERITKCIESGFETNKLYVVDDSYLESLHTKYAQIMKLSVTIRWFQSFAEVTFSLIVVIFFLLEVVYFSIFLDAKTILRKFKYVPVMITTLVILLTYCNVGEIFTDTVDLLPDSIYNAPWHYFSAKDKKKIFSYLQLSQQRVNFSAFGLYPLNANMFQRMCNSVYFYANVRLKLFN